MFTGIIEEIGTITDVRVPDASGADAVITVRGPVVTSDARLGDSIAVSGVCLTVTAVHSDTFTADVMPETLSRSSLQSVTAGTSVNLERAVPVTGRLGGHIVQGHVDGVARLISRTPGPRWDVLRFSLPAELAGYVVEKGSITVSGVSLTVSAVFAGAFEVSLIPTTLSATTLGSLAPGDPVNLEADVIAKYVERLLGVNAKENND